MQDTELFDERWRRQALQGEVEAIRALAEVMLTPLHHFCLYRLGGNRHLCEEAVQETLVRAIRQLEKYDPVRGGNNIFPWLTGLARNEITRILNREKHVSLDELWKRMDRELLSLYERLDSEPLAEEVLQREETRELVNVTMSQLPTHYREALEGKYMSGMSVHDLAQKRQTTDKAMESLLTRARQAFRATFMTLCQSLSTEIH